MISVDDKHLFLSILFQLFQLFRQLFMVDFFAVLRQVAGNQYIIGITLRNAFQSFIQKLFAFHNHFTVIRQIALERPALGHASQHISVIEMVVGNDRQLQRFVRNRLRSRSRLHHGNCSAHLIAHQKQRGAVGALLRRKKIQALRRDVALDIFAEIPRIEIINILCVFRVADVIGHHAADALQADKSVGNSVHLAHRHIFRLRSLFGAAVIQFDLAVGAVEIVRIFLRGNFLKIRTGIVNLLHGVRIPNREGTAAEKIVCVIIPITVVISGVQKNQFFICFSQIDPFFRVNAVIIKLDFVDVAGPFTAVALIGGEQIGFAVRLIGGNTVRHINAAQLRLLIQFRFFIFAGIHFHLTVVLKAQPSNGSKLALFNIQSCDGVGLLQGNICHSSRHRDIFRLQIYRRICVFLENHAVL